MKPIRSLFLLLCFFFSMTLQAEKLSHPQRLYVPSSSNDQSILLLNPDSHELLKTPVFKSITSFKKIEDQYLATAKAENGKWGYINSIGIWLIKPLFDTAKSFSEDKIARVEINNKWGFIKPDGKFLIKPKFNYVSPFQKGLATVQENKKGNYYFINIQGKKVFDKSFARAAGFSKNGLAPIIESNFLDSFDSILKKLSRRTSKNKRPRGFINTQGKIVIRPQFSKVKPFNQHGVAIVKNFLDQYGLIDKQGNWILKPQFEFFWDYSDSGVAWVKRSSFYGGKAFTGYIDLKGKEVWKASYHDFWGEHNGVLMDHQHGFQYYNPFGKLLIKDKSVWAQNFFDAKVTIALRKHWGILKKDGTFKAFDENIVAPLTSQSETVIGFIDGLIPMISKTRDVLYFDRNGKLQYTFDADTMTLKDNENHILKKLEGQPFKVFSYLSQNANEHFQDISDNGKGILKTIETLLNQEAKTYYVPNPLWQSDNDDPYTITDDIEEDELKQGAIKEVAKMYISEESWGTYYFLSDNINDQFVDYIKKLKSIISEKYGKPESGNSETVSTWKIHGKQLSLSYWNDYGDGDFYHQILLEVNP